jgi:hypothetical protein
MKAFLNRWFRVEEINGDHLRRWHLFACRFFKVYIHCFQDSDGPELHDHPKRFISIGLRGWYVEQTEDGFREFSAPWFRTFPASHKHRIMILDRDVWTLVIVGPPQKPWNFFPVEDDSDLRLWNRR